MIQITPAQRHNLNALSQKHSTDRPYFSMLATLHNLIYIVDNQQKIRIAIDLYNTSHRRYSANALFLNEKDWHDGVMRDDWQIAFHITEHTDKRGYVLFDAFCNEITQIIKALSDVFELVKQNNRIHEFCQSFQFDNKSACLQARVGNVLKEDWSQPPSLQTLCAQFIATLPLEASEETILMAYPGFWKTYQDTFSKEDVLKYLTEIVGYDFSEITIKAPPAITRILYILHG